MTYRKRNPPNTPMVRAKEAVGGATELAQRLGVSVRMLDYYQADGVPPKRAVQIEDITGVSADDLCPSWKFNRDAKGKIKNWERVSTDTVAAAQ